MAPSRATASCSLQEWWREVRHVGHGDLRDAPWWPAFDCLSDLVETCTTIIWVGSALHAAVRFGQYAYKGFVPNRPTLTSRLMPDAGEDVTESEFLGSITPRSESLAYMAIASSGAIGHLKPGQAPCTETSSPWEPGFMREPPPVLPPGAEPRRPGTCPGNRHAGSAPGDRHDVDGAARGGSPGAAVDERAARGRGSGGVPTEAGDGRGCHRERRNADAAVRNRGGLVEVSYTLLTPKSDDGARAGRPRHSQQHHRLSRALRPYHRE